MTLVIEMVNGAPTWTATTEPSTGARALCWRVQLADGTVCRLYTTERGFEFEMQE